MWRPLTTYEVAKWNIGACVGEKCKGKFMGGLSYFASNQRDKGTKSRSLCETRALKWFRIQQSEIK